MRFLLATLNRGKLRELQAVLSDLGIELVSLDLFPDLPEAVEDGASFEENARKKALHYWELTSLPSIADDSGLVVDALGGRPGVYSARLAPDDPSRIRAVLDGLRAAGPRACLARLSGGRSCLLLRAALSTPGVPSVARKGRNSLPKGHRSSSGCPSRTVPPAVQARRGRRGPSRE